MTAFSYVFLEHLVAIAMDSQATHGDGPAKGEALGFFTKIFPLPHLNAVLCGTGIQELVLDWFVMIQTRIIARDVVFLDTLATHLLSELAARHPAGDATIYHFGFDLNRRLRGFAYRRKDGFRSEEINYGFAFKPGPEDFKAWFAGRVVEAGVPTAFIELVRRQREYDATQPAEQRVGVGGEVHCFHMTADSGLSLWNCYRFEDYESEYDRIVEWTRKLPQ
jgi:hypothetical protein